MRVKLRQSGMNGAAGRVTKTKADRQKKSEKTKNCRKKLQVVKVKRLYTSTLLFEIVEFSTRSGHSSQEGWVGKGDVNSKTNTKGSFGIVLGSQIQCQKNRGRFGPPRKSRFCDFPPPCVVPFLQENGHAYEVKLFVQSIRHQKPY